MFVWGRVLYNLRPSTEHVQTGVSNEIQGLLWRGSVEWFFHLWHGLPCEHGFVHNAGAVEQEDVAGNEVVILGAT